MKRFGVRFYQGSIGADGEQGNVADLLWDLYQKQLAGTPVPQFDDEGLKYEIRDLEAINNQNFFKGVLAVIRDDAPHIRASNGQERAIDLQEDEGVLEKNFFLFYREGSLLVWQVNGRASHISRFSRYISYISGNTAVFYDIIKEGALDLMNQGVVKHVWFRAARIRNAGAIDPHDWESPAFQMMAGAGGSTFSFKVAVRGRGKGLNATVKGAVHRLLNRGDVRKVEVKLDGIAEPIDLFADCITDRILVTMAGHYPIPQSVYASLAEAKDRQQAALEASLGVGNQILE